MIHHFLNKLPILDQDTVHVIVAILIGAWLLLLVSLAGKGAPVKRYVATCALTVVSLLVIVFIAQQTRRRAGPYQPADDEEIVAPRYHVRVNDREQV